MTGMITLEFIPPPANWEYCFFPAFFLTSTSLHPLSLGMATHQMGPKAKVVTTLPAPLQLPLCPGGLGPGRGQGQLLPHLTSTVPGGGQGERGKK